MLRTVLPILAGALPLPSYGWAIDACVGLVLGALVGVAHVLILVLAARGFTRRSRQGYDRSSRFLVLGGLGIERRSGFGLRRHV